MPEPFSLLLCQLCPARAPNYAAPRHLIVAHVPVRFPLRATHQYARPRPSLWLYTHLHELAVTESARKPVAATSRRCTGKRESGERGGYRGESISGRGKGKPVGCTASCRRAAARQRRGGTPLISAHVHAHNATAQSVPISITPCHDIHYSECTTPCHQAHASHVVALPHIP